MMRKRQREGRTKGSATEERSLLSCKARFSLDLRSDQDRHRRCERGGVLVIPIFPHFQLISKEYFSKTIDFRFLKDFINATNIIAAKGEIKVQELKLYFRIFLSHILHKFANCNSCISFISRIFGESFKGISHARIACREEDIRLVHELVDCNGLLFFDTLWSNEIPRSIKFGK